MPLTTADDLQSGAPRARATGPFAAEAAVKLGAVRASFRRLLDGLGQPARRAADVQHALGLPKVLAWRVFRVSTAAEPLDAAPHVPRPEAMSRVVKAAADRGVPAGVIADVTSACAALESFVEAQAGDRATFESMIGCVDGESDGDGAAVLRDRRAAFQACSRLWGVAAQARLFCNIHHAGARPGTDVGVQISGTLGLRALRPGVKLRVASGLRVEAPAGAGEDAEDAGGPPPPVVPASDFARDALLEEFCSRPLPALTTRRAKTGILETMLEFPGVGRGRPIDLFLRKVIDAPTWSRRAPNAETYMLVVPSEVMIIDSLVPAGWSDPSTARAATYGRLHDIWHALEHEEDDRLPMVERNVHLGQTLDRLHTPDVPGYEELVRHVLRGQGWEGTRFDVYRCRIRYPLLHAVVTSWVMGTDEGP